MSNMNNSVFNEIKTLLNHAKDFTRLPTDPVQHTDWHLFTSTELRALAALYKVRCPKCIDKVVSMQAGGSNNPSDPNCMTIQRWLTVPENKAVYAFIDRLREAVFKKGIFYNKFDGLSYVIHMCQIEGKSGLAGILKLELAEYGAICGTERDYVCYNYTGNRNDPAVLYVEYSGSDVALVELDI